MAQAAGAHTCFFYGTLMNDAILRRVIGTSSEHLEIADAVLEKYTRHHVKGVDYPAVVPAALGKQVIGRDLTSEEASTRGSVVRGLTTSDIRFLDTFEGDEYERQAVDVKLLSSWRPTSGSHTPPNADAPTSVPTHVYIWIASPSQLAPSLWSYQDFLRDKAHLWIGNGSNSDAEYLQVDRRRQMEGKIVHDPQNKENGVHAEEPEYGHAMLKHFSLDPNFLNLNHGGRGVTPKVVTEAKRRFQDLADSAPDLFYQKTFADRVPAVRERVGAFLNCDPDNVTFLLNATTGVNAVLRSMRWQKGDHILYYPNANYGACKDTLMFVRDHYGVELVPVDVFWPISDSDLLSKTKQVIESTQSALAGSGRIRLALIDAIASMPAVTFPWAELCALYKEYNILSLVDAAHLMGHKKIDLKKADPDFWVANAHKWCMTPLSCACFYVPARYEYSSSLPLYLFPLIPCVRISNHHLVETFPISFGYKASREPKTVNTPSFFKANFEYYGTQDLSNVLSIPTAMDFRRDVLGGEERIMKHNHDLALQAAELLSKELGTRFMDNPCSMANIELPVTVSPDDYGKLAPMLVNRLLADYNISAPCFPYNGKLYIRVAAQVYNEIGDYEILLKALKELLAKQDELLRSADDKGVYYVKVEKKEEKSE